MELIRLKNISFAYGRHPALAGINHVFHAGTMTAILGPNGSGKTTLLKTIIGLLKPDTGVVTIHNQNLHQKSPNDIARLMAYVPQTEHNIFAITVFDTILTGRNPYLQWKPGKADIEIVSGIIEELNLQQVAFKNINELSGGQKQKVFVARALAQQTDTLLLDEPAANLDIRHANEVMELLQTLAAKGYTVIQSAHHINLALKYFSDFVMMKEGRILSSGGIEIFDEALMEKIFDVKCQYKKDGDLRYFVF